MADWSLEREKAAQPRERGRRDGRDGGGKDVLITEFLISERRSDVADVVLCSRSKRK